MAEPNKSYKTTCTTPSGSKTYTTTGATKQAARDKALVSAYRDGFSDANCKTSEA